MNIPKRQDKVLLTDKKRNILTRPRGKTGVNPDIFAKGLSDASLRATCFINCKKIIIKTTE